MLLHQDQDHIVYLIKEAYIFLEATPGKEVNTLMTFMNTNHLLMNGMYIHIILKYNKLSIG